MPVTPKKINPAPRDCACRQVRELPQDYLSLTGNPRGYAPHVLDHGKNSREVARTRPPRYIWALSLYRKEDTRVSTSCCRAHQRARHCVIDSFHPRIQYRRGHSRPRGTQPDQAHPRGRLGTCHRRHHPRMGILCRIFALRDYHCWDLTEPLTHFLEHGASQIPEVKKQGDCFV